MALLFFAACLSCLPARNLISSTADSLPLSLSISARHARNSISVNSPRSRRGSGQLGSSASPVCLRGTFRKEKAGRRVGRDLRSPTPPCATWFPFPPLTLTTVGQPCQRQRETRLKAPAEGPQGLKIVAAVGQRHPGLRAAARHGGQQSTSGRPLRPQSVGAGQRGRHASGRGRDGLPALRRWAGGCGHFSQERQRAVGWAFRGGGVGEEGVNVLNVRVWMAAHRRALYHSPSNSFLAFFFSVFFLLSPLPFLLRFFLPIAALCEQFGSGWTAERRSIWARCQSSSSALR